MGGIPPRGIVFKAPGAVHHARWLAKVIYCLKIYLFRKQFKLKKSEADGLPRICAFIVRFYVKAWFNASSAIGAPNHDLTLFQSLINYKQIDAEIADAAIRKLQGHLWYLSEDLVALSFFDDAVPDYVKLKMVRAIKERTGTNNAPKRIQIKEKDHESLLGKDFGDFVTTKSMILFEQYDLPHDFLETSPDSWKTNEAYLQCLEVLTNVRVVNDLAERAVALIEEFNTVLTVNEEQK